MVFNPKTYYLSKNVCGIITNYKILSRKNSFTFYYYRIKLIDYINRYEGYAKTFLLSLLTGQNNFHRENKRLFSLMGISYLLTISGIHIYTFFYFINKLLFYLNIKSRNQLKINIVFYIILLYFTKFNFSVFRFFILYLLNKLSNYKRIKLTKLDIYAITFIILIIIMPNLIFSYGFLISTVSIIFILLSRDKLSSRYRLLTNYKYFFIAFLSILPLITKISSSYNLLAIIISPLIVILFKYVFLVLLFMLLFIPQMQIVFNGFYNILIKVLNNLNYDILTINIRVFRTYEIVFYYIIFIILFINIRKNKYLIKIGLVSLFTFIFILKPYLNFKVYFLDVGQGDTTIIKPPNTNEVIVIDAYGEIIQTLSKLGFTKIKYLIITHEDEDHAKYAQDIINKFKVDTVLLNPYGNYKIKHKNIIKTKKDDFFNFNDINIHILGPYKKEKTPNQNSILLKLTYKESSFMFTGDISSKEELDAVNNYGKSLKSDYLKVSHHGSKTSSSIQFLLNVSPKGAIFSYAKFNTYGLPVKYIMDRYDKLNIKRYETPKEKTIIFDYKKNNIYNLKDYKKRLKYSILY